MNESDKETEKYKRDYAKEAVSRVSRCIDACNGIDDETLMMLASKDDSGRTILQRILDKVSFK